MLAIAGLGNVLVDTQGEHESFLQVDTEQHTLTHVWTLDASERLLGGYAGRLVVLRTGHGRLELELIPAQGDVEFRPLAPSPFVPHAGDAIRAAAC